MLGKNAVYAGLGALPKGRQHNVLPASRWQIGPAGKMPAARWFKTGSQATGFRFFHLGGRSAATS